MSWHSLWRSVLMLALGAASCLAAASQPPGADIQKLFEEFLKAPTRESYLRVHKALTASEAYSPYSLDLGKIGGLVREKKFKEAKALLDKAMPNLLLSPRAHLYGIQIARGLGDDAAVARERDIFRKCLKGILSTGDGSPDRAYIVTRISDEYDALRALRKHKTRQSLMHRDGKAYDAIACADGSQVWFDISAAYAAMSRRLRKGAKPDKKE